MRHDLEILKELFLPLLEEIATYSPKLAGELAGGVAFWAHFNGVVLQGGAALRELLTGYGAKDVAACENLCVEYLSYMAICYCAGQTNPTVEMLLQSHNDDFAGEVSFQKDMLAAIALAGRKAMKAELEQAAEFAGADVAGEEITAAFTTIHRDAMRNDLRKQMKQWDEEAPAHKEPEQRKKRKAIPLLFVRFAAAAAVFTGGIIGVVKVYEHNNRDGAPSANYHHDADAGGATQTYPGADTTAGDANQPASTGSNKPGSRRTDSITQGPGHASVKHDRLPQIILKGTIADVQTGDTVTGVLVTIEDDMGNKQTVLSNDGTFKFDLALHRDFVITGEKEHYRSARLSLSTKDVKETDADDVINATLRLSKEP
jgi:hypothetical protein